MDKIRKFYNSLSANERRRLLMRMGVSQSTFYRRTTDTITAYEIKALLWAGMDKSELLSSLGLQ